MICKMYVCTPTVWYSGVRYIHTYVLIFFFVDDRKMNRRENCAPHFLRMECSDQSKPVKTTRLFGIEKTRIWFALPCDHESVQLAGNTTARSLSQKQQTKSPREQKTMSVPTKKPGIDIVLGAQWGDEGKGKLVDILSQVRAKLWEILGSFSYNGTFVIQYEHF